MNAEEFKAVVQNLRDVIGIIEADTRPIDRRRYQLCLLGNAWANLDKHRLEMEAAETDKKPEAAPAEQRAETSERIRHVCANCDNTVYDTSQSCCLTCHRLGTIEQRLGEIEAAGLRFANAISGVD